MDKTPAKWRIEYTEKLKALPTDQLLVEAFDCQAPDDYDGCFTDKGDWYREESRRLLFERLNLFDPEALGVEHD